MNAVNLIPREARTRGEGLSASPPTLGLIGGLVLVLIAAVLYVTAGNTVATRKSELTQVSAGVAAWTAAGNSYASFVSAAKNRTRELADVRQLASARFPWSDLLSQIGGRMPHAAALSALQADTSAAAAGSTASAVPGVQLTGCAASQSVVAQTMVQLRLVNGISAVTLSTSGDSPASGGSASNSSGQSSGTCPFPVQFQLSLTITPAYAAGSANSSSTATTSAPAVTTSAPAGITSAPAGTTSAPASTTSTPVAAQ